MLLAQNTFECSNSIQPDFAEAHCNLGVVQKELGNDDDAVVSFKKAITIKPNYLEAHYNLGVVLYEKGHLNEAISSFVKALQILPNFEPAYRSIGHALEGVQFTKPQPDIQKILL